MASFIPDGPAIDELLTGPTGPVFKLVRKFVDDALANAETLCPVGEDGGGQMRSRLRADPEIVVPGISIVQQIITDPVDPTNGFRYALVAHEGHGALAAKSTGPMHFFWPAQERWVSANSVNATDGTPFLTHALEIANAANGEIFRLEPGDEHGRVG